MYNVMIVEDEEAHIDILVKKLLLHPSSPLFDVTFARSVEEFQYKAAQKTPDIVFMDIQLEGEMSGIEAVASYANPNKATQFIYVTGFIEFCTNVYKTDHVYFLLKPFKQQELNDAVDKAIAAIDEVRVKSLALRIGGNIVAVRPQDITYIESNKRKIRIFTTNDELETYASLTGLLDQLPKNFVQCHKSFIVNLAFVYELRAEDVLLSTGDAVPVSQKRRTEFKYALIDSLRLLA